MYKAFSCITRISSNHGTLFYDSNPGLCRNLSYTGIIPSKRVAKETIVTDSGETVNSVIYEIMKEYNIYGDCDKERIIYEIKFKLNPYIEGPSLFMGGKENLVIKGSRLELDYIPDIKMMALLDDQVLAEAVNNINADPEITRKMLKYLPDNCEKFSIDVERLSSWIIIFKPLTDEEIKKF